MRVATIAWRSDVGAELCVLEETDDGFSLVGQAIIVEESVPYLVSYAVALAPDWQTRDVGVNVLKPDGRESVDLVVGEERWTRGGEDLPALAGCVDVDLSFTPATNTLPIRRLGLSVGASADIDVAWLRWPQLDVVRAHQTYERLTEVRYRFTQENFTAEVAVDPEGLVTEYADIWRAVGRA